MDVRYLKRLIKVVEQSQINELEVEDGGSRVKIVKGQPVAVPAAAHSHIPAPVHSVAPLPVSDPLAQITKDIVPLDKRRSEESKLVEVSSPMVGTFYRAPSPGAPPFVEVGDRVKIGQTLCILEAMKLMNELECEVSGVIKEICVENAQPVEFGHRLFLIDPEG